jgi:hypothetical protein
MDSENNEDVSVEFLWHASLSCYLCNKARSLIPHDGEMADHVFSHRLIIVPVCDFEYFQPSNLPI